MAESNIRDDSYYVVHRYMVEDLHLKGIELSVYAIIYEFSQNKQKFDRSRKYLADWCGSSKQSVDNALKSLCKKGFLEKFQSNINGVLFCSYRAKTKE